MPKLNAKRGWKLDIYERHAFLNDVAKYILIYAHAKPNMYLISLSSLHLF